MSEIAASRNDVDSAMTLFEIEAFWDDQGTTIVRYVEAESLREALDVVPEGTIVLRINTLGGLYRTTRKEGK